MSGGGIQYAQNAGGRGMVRKCIDEDLIVVVNRVRRGVILDDLTEEEQKDLRRRLIELISSIEEVRYENSTITGAADIVGKHLDEDMRSILKAIDYYKAGDYGEDKAVEKIREALQ